jgi:hypothetical protein
MSSGAEVTRFTLHVDAGADADDEERDRVTRQLRDELRDLDGVEPVKPVEAGTVPEGAKSAEAMTLGALAVTILPSVIPKFIEFLQTWSMRGENRTVKIEARIGDRSVNVEVPRTMSPDELKGLVDMLTGALTAK